MCLTADTITESSDVCASDEPVVKYLRWDYCWCNCLLFNTLEMLTPIYNRILQAHDIVTELLLNSWSRCLLHNRLSLKT